MTKEKHYDRKTFLHNHFDRNTFDRGVSFAPNAGYGVDGRRDRNEGVTRAARCTLKTAG